MIEPKWGVLGPDTLESMRRVRTLGLGASVRHFNDRAVPGLGGIWFGKQLLWALLGIDMVERLRQQGKRAKNIETANAIEALACLIAITEFDGSEPAITNRIKGRSKLAGHSYPTFAEARKRAYYITQPMRMGTVQPLVALGLVVTSGSRFNSFSMADLGHEFLDLACTDPFSGMRSKIFDWVNEKMPVITNRQALLKDFLRPDTPLARPACDLLLQALQADEDRNNVLHWLKAMKKATEPLSWARQPDELHAEHWQALYAGSRLFRTRNAAVDVLNEVERQLAMTKHRELPLAAISCADSLHVLREAAKEFLDTDYPDPIARKLCLHCTAKQEHDILRHLLSLDGRVIRLVGDMVMPGPAFNGDLSTHAHDMDDGTNDDYVSEAGQANSTDWKAAHPLVMLPDISSRLFNFEELQADLRHQPLTAQEAIA